MYNKVPTTCFGLFLTGHHQVGIHCQRNYIPTINIDISVSVSTEKEGGDYPKHVEFCTRINLETSASVGFIEK